MIKMDRVNSFSPTPSSSFQQPVFYDHSSFPQIDPSLQYETTQTLMTPHGQMVMHMTHAPPHPMSSGQPHYIVEDGTTPYHPQMLSHASMQHHHQHHHQVVSPTDHLDARHNQGLQRNNSLPGRSVMAVNRPMMTRGHSMQVPPRPNGLHRQASLQHPSHRSASPHMMAGDIFDPQPGHGSPVKRPATVAVEAQQYEPQEMFYQAPPFGISPARAMGPPPVQPPRFSPHHQELMITPYGQKTGGEMVVPSSAASSSSSSLSSVHDPTPLDVSDDENDDSPTKGPSTTRAMSKMQLNEKNPSTRPTRGQTTIVVRPQRPAAAAIAANTNPNIVKPGVGGRTSAKFAKVAEDPGVEGIPPGPRSMDRPGPSFACIIGQAILRCKAGGLSLEHIYRYVETAYPFFKNDNPAWRNSVRHNLSIHKMFATIARTEKFPPGKGGIWIIHEDEKCHWPEDNKFIKNFPSSHPHYAVCRQTLHDREKEQAQMEKAAKEGRVYIPKKGKKGRKLPGEDGVDMVRTSSETGELFGMSGRSVTPVQFHEQEGEEEGEFLPLEEEPAVIEIKPEPEIATAEVRAVQPSAIAPPRFERKEKKRLLEDEENVFVTTKRVRVTEPMPLAPIAIPQDQVVLDDTFITPERERPASNNAKLMSSAFKTPALVNTSSSPGSSPMPPTITRMTHHPSALAQAWTHDDMAATVESSPQLPMLESAFDFQPKQPKPRMRAVGSDEDVPIVNAANPPKTPLTRSSAAREIHKTPVNMLHKSPLTFGRSPAQPPPSISALLSTPMWEMGGCLDRMKDQASSPTHPIRSPMPPTSPTRYAMLMGSSASPSSKRLREFSV